MSRAMAERLVDYATGSLRLTWRLTYHMTSSEGDKMTVALIILAESMYVRTLATLDTAFDEIRGVIAHLYPGFLTKGLTSYFSSHAGEDANWSSPEGPMLNWCMRRCMHVLHSAVRQISREFLLSELTSRGTNVTPESFAHMSTTDLTAERDVSAEDAAEVKQAGGLYESWDFPHRDFAHYLEMSERKFDGAPPAPRRRPGYRSRRWFPGSR